ncbi:hypothetical protein J3Q64DRAFT_1632557 [Phycomyces blakesleeanus]|uniref:Uncharacterized protein n=2 Tax=Phycomyces blakesleeanus TaxID=4837 RepID=A0A167QGM0_PHYB8|nr:hypothetical protein PHYBLDRAFT_58712 [Phycomyces blakesleeanus NRRL 1555(-)]OAD79664.1 hypothetical protein PHYBLDRAFT_58712 [Phycomyces blakesleeanus NRRL 1555(-)]|eukprot:XP_018297704.1 hypothetical protein PHYBLDRAFT_58712 [Phycomyces blakesleeanus NRRL 1555(-)]
MIMMTTYATSAKGKKPYKSWLKDGVNGGPSSMDILVHWLSVKANYAKWRGDDSERTPKKLLLEGIIDKMREVGIYHRLAKDVASKISTLQSNYRSAREWSETEGEKLRGAGAKEESIHEEILKRFPYWDALREVFGSTRTTSWPMSISSIMHRVEEDELLKDQLKYEETSNEEDEDGDTDSLSPPKRRRQLSEDSPHSLATTTVSTSGSPVLIRPLPRVVPIITPRTQSHLEKRDALLAESLVQVTREKEAGRMKRSHDMLEFLREKRLEREQLLIEKEKTRRIKAKSDLVKHLIEAGFSKAEITEQLKEVS